MNDSYVAFDLETANDNPNSVCEIAAVKFVAGREIDSWSSIVRPATSNSLNPVNYSIHGITQDEILNAPTLKDLWSDFSNFIDGLPVAAHNATQDLNKLIASASSCFEDQGFDLPFSNYVCTLTMARRSKNVNPIDFSIRELAEFFNIPHPQQERNNLLVHTALADARLAGSVLSELAGAHNLDSIEGLLKELELKIGIVAGNQIAQRCVGKSKSFFGHSKAPNKEEYESIKAQIISDGWALENHQLRGKSLLLTLSLDSLTDAEFVLACAIVGADYKTSVTKKLDYLVEGEDSTGTYERGTTSKSKSAREYNSQGSKIEIIDENSFIELLGTHVLDTIQEIRNQKIDSQIADKDKKLQERLEKLVKRFVDDPDWTSWVVSEEFSVYFSESIESQARSSLIAATQAAKIPIAANLQDSLMLIVDESNFGLAPELATAIQEDIGITHINLYLENYPEVLEELEKSKR